MGSYHRWSATSPSYKISQRWLREEYREQDKRHAAPPIIQWFCSEPGCGWWDEQYTYQHDGKRFCDVHRQCELLEQREKPRKPHR